MKKFLFFLSLHLFSFLANAEASFCKKDFLVHIKMNDDWHKTEQRRLENEELLLKKYSNYISKETKKLVATPHSCKSGEECDPIKNCQMETYVKDVTEMEYSMKIDIGIIIKKSYCSVIGKCVGYNDFEHNIKVTASENRLIDIKKDNAIFYYYFYSANSKSYQPPFNMTNFHTGSELYLNDAPNFSPNERFMVEVRSMPKQEDKGDFPSGFNINIYEMNEFGEYKNVEPAEIDPQDPNKIISTFLSRNPSCGPTPHFHSWKSDKEIRLSMLPPAFANAGRRVILSYDQELNKWGCQEDLFPAIKRESYLPNSTAFSSNLSIEQIYNLPNF